MEKTPTVRCRNWHLRLSNYSNDEYTALYTFCTLNCDQYIIGKEVGKQGTPHLQMFMSFKDAKSNVFLKKLNNKLHLEVCKKDAIANYRYCSKEGNFVSNIVPPTPKIKELSPNDLYNNQMKLDFDEVKWYPWQQEIIDLVETEPDNRTVHWYWEEKGNKGKSFLSKYLDWKYDAIIANGKQADVFNQYRIYLEKKQPKLAIIDIPRSHENYVCYSTLEAIKNGLAYSGKYEGGKLRICRHHLIIFANFEPNYSKLSEDRWIVHELA